MYKIDRQTKLIVAGIVAFLVFAVGYKAGDHFGAKRMSEGWAQQFTKSFYDLGNCIFSGVVDAKNGENIVKIVPQQTVVACGTKVLGSPPGPIHPNPTPVPPPTVTPIATP